MFKLPKRCYLWYLHHAKPSYRLHILFVFPFPPFTFLPFSQTPHDSHTSHCHSTPVSWRFIKGSNLFPRFDVGLTAVSVCAKPWPSTRYLVLKLAALKSYMLPLVGVQSCTYLQVLHPDYPTRRRSQAQHDFTPSVKSEKLWCHIDSCPL